MGALFLKGVFSRGQFSQGGGANFCFPRTTYIMYAGEFQIKAVSRWKAPQIFIYQQDPRCWRRSVWVVNLETVFLIVSSDCYHYCKNNETVCLKNK